MRLIVALGLFLAVHGQLLAQQAPLAVTYEPATFRPVIRVGPVLQSGELEQAARSGLPIRVRVRVELWQDRFFDQLVDSTSWSSIIGYEPIAQQFFVRSVPGPPSARTFAGYSAARSVVETEVRPGMRPPRPGRFYYTVSLQIETLSLTDLEELERWLQGELQPAVRGQRSVSGALGQGARRLMLRLLDLPTHRYDARTGRFVVP
ncbi:hypothetical protein BH23GEM10_BH23GEM10_13510 [soil metagenome]